MSAKRDLVWIKEYLAHFHPEFDYFFTAYNKTTRYGVTFSNLGNEVKGMEFLEFCLKARKAAEKVGNFSSKESEPSPTKN